MIPTLYGFIVAAIGLGMLLFKRPLREFLAVLLVASVMGAAEAVALPMLGGAALTVPYFFAPFVILRLILMATQNPGLFMEALRANLWLVLFAVYGLIAALLAPRAFEGSIALVTMRPSATKTLLTPTSQNITQSVYICLSAMTSLAAYAAARISKFDETFTKGWLWASSAFLLFALVDLVGFYGGRPDLMDWAKTASYEMLSQSFDGIRRISGSFPEPSSFAGFGAAPLLFFSFRWLLDLKSGISGLFAAALAVILALSTSTTAYGLLAVTLLTVIGGLVIVPMKGSVRRRKFMELSSAAGAFVLVASIIVFLSPKLVASFLDVVEAMTIKKAGSDSATERGAWAAQGFAAFAVSNGLGIGPGSFRSSGIIQAVIGSMGVAGCLFISLHLLGVFRSIFYRPKVLQDRMVVVTGLASLLMLTPQIAASPGPDPGILFSVLSGATLGLLRTARLRTKLQAAESLEDPRPTPAPIGPPYIPGRAK